MKTKKESMWVKRNGFRRLMGVKKGTFDKTAMIVRRKEKRKRKKRRREKTEGTKKKLSIEKIVGVCKYLSLRQVATQETIPKHVIAKDSYNVSKVVYIDTRVFEHIIAKDSYNVSKSCGYRHRVQYSDILSQKTVTSQCKLWI